MDAPEHATPRVESHPSDRPLLDLIRRSGPLTVAEMASTLDVTPTAVRNRLGRLIGDGLVERRACRGRRGRPRHVYQASAETHRRLGQNYADLAAALWEEMVRSVADLRLRRAMFGRVIDRMAGRYRSEVRGEGWGERLDELGALLRDRGVETQVDRRDDALPVLHLYSCPYFELAQADRAICALERKMFEKVLGRGVHLSHCRLDGHRSCEFQAEPAHAS